MTNNIDRATKLLYNEGVGSGDTADYLAHRLADAGLLAPDLPEPTCEHTDTWLVNDLDIEAIGDSVHLEWPDEMDDMRGTTTRSLNLDRRMILAILAAATCAKKEADRADA